MKYIYEQRDMVPGTVICIGDAFLTVVRQNATNNVSLLDQNNIVHMDWQTQEALAAWVNSRGDARPAGAK